MYGVHSHIQKAIWNGLLDDPKTKRVWTLILFDNTSVLPSHITCYGGYLSPHVGYLQALVVPAFEFPKSGPTFPKTKQDLINLWNKEKAFPFQ